MFNQLSSQLQKAMKFLRGEGKITEKNMEEALRMIRLAFLEADVNYQVVKRFVDSVKKKALNEKVLLSLTPAQQVIKVVREELTSILGQEEKNLNFSSSPPSIFMLVGLQGSGKTTTCGKLSKWMVQLKKNPLLASFDLKRPAAQEQMQSICKQLNLPFYEMIKETSKNPSKHLTNLVKYTQNHGYDPLIVDTAGRLHVDDELMEELCMVKDILNPVEVIFIGDAMIGQDAVKSAEIFEERIGLTSVILTKLDGDARGGAALSIVEVTGKPIKFIGVGEKFDKFEVFHPDRMASRILGMGDVLTLIEKAEEQVDLEETKKFAQKLKKQEFTLQDFKEQMVKMKKMGSLSQILKMMPSSGPFKQVSNLKIDDKKMIHFEAIIDSMTEEERENPKIINGSRRVRIARGSGRTVAEVNQLVKQFSEMKKMMKKHNVQKMISSFPIYH
ncbi:MAG: signal recognition particle protein [Candidatus Aminicenantaceae bacterium]